MSRQQEKVQPIRLASFKPGEHSYRNFDCTVPCGTKIEDLEESNMFSLVGSRLSCGDEVRVVCEDQSWMARVYVKHAAGSEVRVCILGSHKLECADNTAIDINSGYEVQWKGPSLKHCVVNKKDGSVVRQGIAQKSRAYKELEEHIRAINS